jgi:hypothetical protein
MFSPHLPGQRGCPAGIGTSVFQRLPRYRRAGPSTSLDEKIVAGSVPYMIIIVKIIKTLRVLYQTLRVYMMVK